MPWGQQRGGLHSLTVVTARPRSRGRGMAAFAAALILTLLAGCAAGAPGPSSTSLASTDDGRLLADQQGAAASSGPPDAPAPAAPQQPSAAASAPAQSNAPDGSLESFAALSQRLGGSLGLAYSPIGIGHTAVSLGELRAGPGWSTMKVPLAIAVLKAVGDQPSSQMTRLMALAITQSDNDAAMALWSQLGAPGDAAAQVQAVLQAGGDPTTVVPSTVVRPGYSPFGQANWSLAAQATFAAALPCLAHTGPVLELMRRVTPSQRWGAGTQVTTVAFKGGWGPGTNGAYLVRQLAIARLPDGSRVGLALAAIAGDGRFDTGVAHLNALAAWAAQNIRTRPLGQAADPADADGLRCAQ